MNNLNLYYEMIDKYIKPLTTENWDRKNQNILDHIKLILKDTLYIKSLISLFPNYSQLIYKTLLAKFNYVEKKQNSILINYNERISNLYFIIKGKLNIYKYDEETETDIFDYSLNEGKLFGEEFFTNYSCEESPLLLKCETNCILGVLSKEDYELIFQKINVIEKSNIAHFLVKLHLFTPADFLTQKIMHCLIKRYFHRNEILFKQGDPFRCFYFIREGKINLSLKIVKKVKCNLSPEIILGNKPINHFTLSYKHILKGKYTEKNNYKLFTISKGELIGDIEYYNEVDKYYYTAICEEDCQLFEVNMKLFSILINNENYKSFFEDFYNKIQNKMNIFHERLYDIKGNMNNLKKFDYILSKNKFTKNMLEFHPLSEKQNKIEEFYINSGANPVKIRPNFKNLKSLHVKKNKVREYLSLNSIKSTNRSRNININNENSNKYSITSSLKLLPKTLNKAFLTNDVKKSKFLNYQTLINEIDLLNNKNIKRAQSSLDNNMSNLNTTLSRNKISINLKRKKFIRNKNEPNFNSLDSFKTLMKGDKNFFADLNNYKNKKIDHKLFLPNNKMKTIIPKIKIKKV